ncbi:probable serine/threonine-protein kinase kinX [Diadema setosum]|uniref:probable serine/threonine-protein kinase kinX n=1 Tax=Diadema setosum TaxID=31175 RepID=UPI003B3B47C9
MTEAAVQFGLVSVEGEEVTPGGLWREFGEMKQRHTLLQSEMDDLKRAETDMMKICAPGIDGSDYIKSYDGDYEELGTNFVKDLISSLRFINYRQEVMIKTLRYHLTVFHKNILAQRGSLYTDMSYVDRAVVEKLSSLEDITTIHSDELSPWIGKPANNEGGLLLGQGSFGKVFLKRYRGAAVAVKVPHCKPVDRKDDDEDDEKIQARRKMNHARTIMEARVHLFFDGHPSFPKLHGIVDVCGSPSLVIEFLGDKSTAEVHSLSHAVRLKTPSLSPDAWFDIVSDITNGVKALHEKGLLHNDLKSNNILLQWDQDEARWRGVIIDLGRVSTTILPLRHRSLPKEEQEAYRKGAVYQHLAPEHILDLEPTTILADIFSLGKLLGQIAGVVRNKVLLDLAAEMTSSKPYLRPSLKQIDKAIKKAKQKIRTQV